MIKHNDSCHLHLVNTWTSTGWFWLYTTSTPGEYSLWSCGRFNFSKFASCSFKSSRFVHQCKTEIGCEECDLNQSSCAVFLSSASIKSVPLFVLASPGAVWSYRWPADLPQGQRRCVTNMRKTLLWSYHSKSASSCPFLWFIIVKKSKHEPVAI